MANTMTGGFPDDLGKWLAVAGLLVSLGVLPKTWQKGLGTAAALYWLYTHW
jgi:hypothetical protein